VNVRGLCAPLFGKMLNAGETGRTAALKMPAVKTWLGAKMDPRSKDHCAVY